MFRQFEALSLVIRSRSGPVQRGRTLQHPLVDQPADDLAMLENERDLVAAYLEYGAASRTTSLANVRNPGSKKPA
jgi:hypothetical protein